MDESDQQDAAALPPEVIYLSFCAEISPSTAEEFLKMCCEVVNARAKSLYILFSTTGGSIAEGIHIYNMLRSLPLKVITHNVGVVQSVGIAIFLAGEERYANPGTTFMFHGVTVPIQSSGIDESGLLALLDRVCSSQKQIANVLRERAGFSSDKTIHNLFTSHITHDTKFAKKHGIIQDVRQAKLASGHPVYVVS